ncbi:putative mitochondrial ornithine carrier protein AmcA/Ort1 [Polychytrium aggregatum]|uniref:putative mitochondrial ornithine carrier protein AmcA/Ort1 n=1 Tax=Polychytrium aggregatum TaxID=110093 RepID=UPI0022FE23D5|nr:putative mitochondrial ornithine carrier protein AmcA/Ort1 [Polychytrium aggregatum]KAI9208138.1 putative mitochondrial ornithine carrier protein AmcA/Ort1 [Polychytrium aggregatum]
MAHSSDSKKQISSFGDLVCGSAAGITGKLVEYPFDTVKVRLQTQPHAPTAGGITFKGPLDCFARTIKAEGFLGLYKGLSAPLVGSMIENSGLFVAYNYIQRVIRYSSGTHPDTPLSLSQLTAAGFMSGAVISLILTPIELVKCRLQLEGLAAHSATGASPVKQKGPFTVIAETLRHDGVAGFYRGHLGTFLREAGGGAAWFGTYELIIRYWITSSTDPQVRSKEDLSPWQVMGAGAVAGMAFNGSLFPADVIKSRQQALPGNPSFLQVAREVYKAQGIKGFYRGCGITIARSAPSSAVIFGTYEFTSRKYAQYFC